VRVGIAVLRSGLVESAPKVAVAPVAAVGWLDDAVRAGGGEVVGLDEATALVWAHPMDGASLGSVLAEHADIEWVQLPWAGVEPFADVFDRDHRWTCAKGVYADPVAEHALAMLLAGFRNLAGYARSRGWGPQVGRNLYDSRIVIVGGGGITESLLPLLAPFRCDVTVVRRHAHHLDGAARVVTADRLDEVLPGADAVVLALSATPATHHLIGAHQLDLMAPHAWLVNVARGTHVDTDALVTALEREQIGGAALDVTDPEPLPERHPLWSEPRCLITPHTANTPEMARPLLARRITENVRRYAAGEPLLGPVDPDLGY